MPGRSVARDLGGSVHGRDGDVAPLSLLMDLVHRVPLSQLTDEEIEQLKKEGILAS